MGSTQCVFVCAIIRLLTHTLYRTCVCMQLFIITCASYAYIYACILRIHVWMHLTHTFMDSIERVIACMQLINYLRIHSFAFNYAYIYFTYAYTQLHIHTYIHTYLHTYIKYTYLHTHTHEIKTTYTCTTLV